MSRNPDILATETVTRYITKIGSVNTKSSYNGTAVTMSGGSTYPRAPPQGYATYTSVYPTNVQYQNPQVLPPTGYTGYAPAGPPVGVAGAPPYAEAPPPYSEFPQTPQAGIQQNVCIENGFDYRARFDGIAQPRIPPPPPGVAPNAAQIASMQGHQVTATQEQRHIFW